MNFRVLTLLVLTACRAPRGVEPRQATVSRPPLVDSTAIAAMVQGVQAAKEGQRERACSLLRESLRLDGSLWEARYDLGILLASTGDLAGAEVELATVSRVAVDSQEAALAVAEVRRRRGEAKLAADGLGEFVSRHATAIEARTVYVGILRESGQVDKAIVQAREVLVRKPADATALAELALSHLAKNENVAAGLLAKQALESSPNSAVAHRATGLLDLANGDDAEAFVEFRKASQADPRDTISRLNMGVVLLRAGAYARAEEQYREILKVSSDDVDAQVGLAAALRGEGDGQHPQRFADAHAILEKVLATNPHQTSALFNVGVLEADFMKRPADAAMHFRRFLLDSPPDHSLRADAERYVSAAGANQPSAPPPPTATPPGARTNK